MMHFRITLQRSVLVGTLAALLLMTGVVSAHDAPTCEPGFRLFTHELLGDQTPDGICIPEQPQRIAFGWDFQVPALLRGGVPLAAIGEQDYVIHEFPEWKEVIEGIPGIELPPNLEKTLAIHPDLIIEPSWAAADNYDELSKIAPTVVFRFDGTYQWKQLAEMYFEIAGKLDAYDALMAEYDARAKELGVLIGDPQEISLSLVALWNPNRVYTDYSPGGMIAADVGFARPESQILKQTLEEVTAAGGYSFFFPLPWEEIQKAEGDFIIAFGDFETDEGVKFKQEVEANPLWQALGAVKADKVYYTSVNWAGGDIAGAHAILDDIAKAFGVADQLSPNPYKTPLKPLPEVTEVPASS